MAIKQECPSRKVAKKLGRIGTATQELLWNCYADY